jgi:hypothetical protein
LQTKPTLGHSMLELPTCMQCTDRETILKQMYSFLHTAE